ncbi:MAG: hypothetical protein JW861_01620 [Bacteroidales bacterium]|nr:hypothetical protein [Bacteroidales bacterium]
MKTDLCLSGRTGVAFILLIMAILAMPSLAQKNRDAGNGGGDTIKSDIVSGLKFRSIGPAFTSGRIADFAVNPENKSEYYIAVASGNIWKTNNNGTTFSPVFDKYGSYSIGCLAMDPRNPNVIWAGTGENNHQRSVGYGDGVYRSLDGGKSWKNMGLKESRHIGQIAIDPRNSNIVFAAAEGSLWGPGGDRGLFRTEDGGQTWKKVLEISEHTGVNNVVIDPEDPNIMYATSEQRRRHVFTKIGGGPETAVYKSTDAGMTWRKLKSGLPGSDMGGIGIAVSPVDNNIVYAIIEAAEDDGGFYRSLDKGESWSKMSDYHASGQYYNEIFCDPVDPDKVYSMETVSQVTLDGGKTWKPIGNNKRHVDDHAMWIDPDDTRHFMIGGDGGIYETFDDGSHFIHKTNLPVTQFYRVAVDNTEPFYWVYGGTQDNSSFGGPSRNLKSDGVSSCEWVVTLGGDGFWQAIDPTNPDILYSEYQYGNIYRFDKKSGEALNIKPQPRKGEETYKWNWNAPFIISHHQPSRLYMAANKVFKSDDRGQSWQVISDDITTQIDRNNWPVMGRYWGIDAVAKDVSTSLFGTAVSLEESPLRQNLLYVGTDDGLIQVTEDEGENWRMISSFPGVPENTYVSDIMCSRFDESTVYAAFDNHKRDDFNPYLLKSNDRGQSWASISGSLPEKGTVYCIEQDPVMPELLFAGTEFGVFFTVDEGNTWTQLKSGIPTIAVYDMAIQERESDLVLATFGRGFYILDDYSPLRYLNQEILDDDAHIFPVKDAWMYIPQNRGGYGSGSTVFLAGNPPFGATLTYYLKEAPKTLRQLRKEREKELVKENKPIPIPSMDEIRAEENEVKPHLVFTFSDEQGNVIRKLTAAASKGINRITWNLRFPDVRPVRVRDDRFDPMATGGDGMLVMPGNYQVTMDQYVRGEVTRLYGPEPFRAVVLENATLPAPDRTELVAFQHEVAKLSRAMWGAERFAYDLVERVRHLKQTAYKTPGVSFDLVKKIENLEKRLDDIIWTFEGQEPVASQEENLPAVPSLNERLNSIVWAHWRSTSAPTRTQQDVFTILAEEFPPVLDDLKSIHATELPALEKELEDAGAPWTPGRIPEWDRR